MKTVHIIFLLAVACMLVPCQSSMALWGKTTTPTVKLSNEGRIYVGKKSRGIKPNTRIVIEIPHNTSPDAIEAIAKELLRHGYRRYVFNKPVKAVAEKGLDPLIKHLEKKPKK
jgi:uncharacterized protein (DUF362 family)